MRNFKCVITIVLLLSTISIEANDERFDGDFLGDIVNELKNKSGLLSGTSIAIVKGDKVIYKGNFGYKNIARRLPVDDQTQFYIASTTKPMTALNYLIDAKEDEALSKLTLIDMFPEFALEERNAIRAEQLLQHTASINNPPLVLATAYSGVHSPSILERLVNNQSITSSENVGEFKYTNVGYNIYSIFSDKHFESSWQQKLTTQIFKPAGMHSTTAKYTAIEESSNVALTYSLVNRNRNDVINLSKVDKTMHAAGGVYSTASDLARFLIAQINNGIIDGEQVYSPEIIARSQVRRVKTNSKYGDFKRDGYAWGWYTGEFKNERMLHHFGGFSGVHAHLSFIPKHKLGLVVLNSEDYLSANLTGIVANYVYGSLLGEKEISRSVDDSVAKLVARLAGIDSILEKEHNKIMSRDWSLSLPTTKYVGKYSNPLMGSINISLNKSGKLDVSWGVMYSESTGMDEIDQIRVELTPTKGSIINFNVSEQVESLEYKGLFFTKVDQSK